MDVGVDDVMLEGGIEVAGFAGVGLEETEGDGGGEEVAMAAGGPLEACEGGGREVGADVEEKLWR